MKIREQTLKIVPRKSSAGSQNSKLSPSFGFLSKFVLTTYQQPVQISDFEPIHSDHGPSLKQNRFSHNSFSPNYNNFDESDLNHKSSHYDNNKVPKLPKSIIRHLQNDQPELRNNLDILQYFQLMLKPILEVLFITTYIFIKLVVLYISYLIQNDYSIEIPSRYSLVLLTFGMNIHCINQHIGLLIQPFKLVDLLPIFSYSINWVVDSCILLIAAQNDGFKLILFNLSVILGLYIMRCQLNLSYLNEKIALKIVQYFIDMMYLIILIASYLAYYDFIQYESNSILTELALSIDCFLPFGGFTIPIIDTDIEEKFMLELCGIFCHFFHVSYFTQLTMIVRLTRRTSSRSKKQLDMFNFFEQLVLLRQTQRAKKLNDIKILIKTNELIQHFKGKSMIDQLYLFGDFSQEFKYKLSKLGQFMEASHFYSLGQIDDLLIFLRGTGKILVNLTQNYQEERRLTTDSFQGSLSFFTGQKDQRQFRVEGDAFLFQIGKAPFLELLERFPLDKEKYFVIKDTIQLNRDLSPLGVKCLNCESYDHDQMNCPTIRYLPNPSEVIQKYLMQSDQVRESQARIKKKRFRTRINLKQIQMKQKAIVIAQAMNYNHKYNFQEFDSPLNEAPKLSRQNMKSNTGLLPRSALKLNPSRTQKSSKFSISSQNQEDNLSRLRLDSFRSVNRQDGQQFAPITPKSSKQYSGFSSSLSNLDEKSSKKYVDSNSRVSYLPVVKEEENNASDKTHSARSLSSIIQSQSQMGNQIVESDGEAEYLTIFEHNSLSKSDNRSKSVSVGFSSSVLPSNKGSSQADSNSQGFGMTGVEMKISADLDQMKLYTFFHPENNYDVVIERINSYQTLQQRLIDEHRIKQIFF